MEKKPPWKTFSTSPSNVKQLFYRTFTLWRENIEEIYNLEKNFKLYSKGTDNILIEILHKSFNSVKNSKSFKLEELEKIFPIPLLFISPRKHAIVIYSIYRNAIGIEKNSANKMANYEEFVSYLFKLGNTTKDLTDFYIFCYNYLKLLKLATPFRKICGLETGKRHYKNESIISGKLKEKTIELFCFPTNITFCIQKIMHNSGFEVALAFVYKLCRASENIGKLLKRNLDDRTEIIIEKKLKSLLTWYNDYFSQNNEDKKRFTILAKAHMSEKNICIAGIFGKGMWGRLLYTSEKLPISLLKEKNVHYNTFDILNLSILHRRVMSPHTEDYVINWNKPPEIIDQISLNERSSFLVTNCETSIMLKEAQYVGTHKVADLLQRLDRSLILIGPVNLDFVLFKKGIVKKYQARIEYSISDTNIKSDGSISCTDLLWRKLGYEILSEFNLNVVKFSDKDLKEIFGIRKVFLVVGLSRKYKGIYWELIVGIHTIPDLSIIFKRLSNNKTINALKKFLKLHEEDFISLYSNITLDIGQRNLPDHTKKCIHDVLRYFEDHPSDCIFQLIEFYENEVRDYIKSKISAKTPKNWYRKHVEELFDNSKVQKIDLKFEKDETKHCQHIYNHPNPLIYTNLEDLPYIITYSDANRGNYRQKYFKEIEDITLYYMHKIEEYRNAIFHTRPIKNEEDAIFYVIKVLETMSS